LAATLNYFEEKLDLYLVQFDELRKYYPNLKDQMESGDLYIRGKVSFREDFDTGFIIDDCYTVEIAFSPEYPHRPPKAKDICNEISKNFHKNKDGSFCFGAPSEVYLRFMENPTILHFVHNILVPFLYSFRYWKELNGKMPPWGQLDHYGKGLIQYYSKIFRTENTEATIELLRAMVNKNYKQSMLCPCGSLKKIKKCHAKILLSRYNKVPDDIIRYELSQMEKSNSLYGKINF
jgi:hypothetical protein